MAAANSAQSHYDHLAGSYTERASVHADERYHLECLRWMNGFHRILDIGCGSAQLLTRLKETFEVFGVDLSFQMLSAGVERGHVVASFAQQLPFESQTYDGAISINLLEHVSNPADVIREIARILKPGGRVILCTPAAEWALSLDLAEKLGLKIPEGPHRFLSGRELEQWSRSAGLQIVAHRRILTMPILGKAIARLAQSAERWTPSLGFVNLLVAERENR